MFHWQGSGPPSPNLGATFGFLFTLYARFCGLPPIVQRTHNGWGTQHFCQLQGPSAPTLEPQKQKRGEGGAPEISSPLGHDGPHLLFASSSATFMPPARRIPGTLKCST